MNGLLTNILLSVAGGLIFFGLPVLIKSPKVKIILFGAGITIIIWIWVFYALSKTEESIINQKKNGKNNISTLHDLFLNDFTTTHVRGTHDLLINNKIKYTVEYIIWSEFDSKSLYFSVYFPKSKYTFDAGIFMIPMYEKILNSPIKFALDGMVYHEPGSHEERYSELTFTGRVYVYHEAKLLPCRIDSLFNKYKEAGLHPQFRSREYLLIKNSSLL